MKEFKNLFLKSVILIFIMISFITGFNTYTPRVVYASDFDDWSFSLGKENTPEQNKIIISDGGNYLGPNSAKTKGDAWNLVLNRYKLLIVGFTGIATLTMVLLAVFLFTKLSSEAANPQARSQTIKWIGCLIIAAGLLGAITLIFSYSYGVFR